MEGVEEQLSEDTWKKIRDTAVKLYGISHTKQGEYNNKFFQDDAEGYKTTTVEYLELALVKAKKDELAEYYNLPLKTVEKKDHSRSEGSIASHDGMHGMRTAYYAKICLALCKKYQKLLPAKIQEEIKNFSEENEKQLEFLAIMHDVARKDNEADRDEYKNAFYAAELLRREGHTPEEAIEIAVHLSNKGEKDLNNKSLMAILIDSADSLAITRMYGAKGFEYSLCNLYKLFTGKPETEAAREEITKLVELIAALEENNKNYKLVEFADDPEKEFADSMTTKEGEALEKKKKEIEEFVELKENKEKIDLKNYLTLNKDQQLNVKENESSDAYSTRLNKAVREEAVPELNYGIGALLENFLDNDGNIIGFKITKVFDGGIAKTANLQTGTILSLKTHIKKKEAEEFIVDGIIKNEQLKDITEEMRNLKFAGFTDDNIVKELQKAINESDKENFFYKENKIKFAYIKSASDTINKDAKTKDNSMRNIKIHSFVRNSDNKDCEYNCKEYDDFNYTNHYNRIEKQQNYLKKVVKSQNNIEIKTPLTITYDKFKKFINESKNKKALGERHDKYMQIIKEVKEGNCQYVNDEAYDEPFGTDRGNGHTEFMFKKNEIEVLKCPAKFFNDMNKSSQADENKIVVASVQYRSVDSLEGFMNEEGELKVWRNIMALPKKEKGEENSWRQASIYFDNTGNITPAYTKGTLKNIFCDVYTKVDVEGSYQKNGDFYMDVNYKPIFVIYPQRTQ